MGGRWAVDWGARPRAGGRRSRWERRPDRRVNAAQAEQPVVEEQHLASDGVATKGEVRPRKTQHEAWHDEYVVRARKLWQCDYAPPLHEERLEEPQLWETTSLLFSAQTSTYRQRMTDERLALKYDAKADKQVRDTVAV